MNKGKIVWSDQEGDLRKKKSNIKDENVIETEIILHLRRLTTGKGRPVVEIKNLPVNKKWCKQLSKNLKKTLGVGGAFKNDYIEIHGDKFKEVILFLEEKSLKWKKTGG